MINFKKSIFMLSIGAILLSGCSETSEDTQTESSTSVDAKDYDICVYNSDTNIGEAFRNLCDEYTERKGIIIRTITPSVEESTIDNLDSYMNSEYPPDIFTVNSMEEMEILQLSENIWDFNNATEEDFKTISNNIPTELRLSSNSTNNFGIPATIESYGYIADPKMIASLFGGEKYRKVISDLKSCTYEEFVYFIEMLNNYIYSGYATEIILNGNTYDFVTEKGDFSNNLTGVFSADVGDYETSGCYLMNPTLASVFKSPTEAFNAQDSDVEMLSSPLMNYIEYLDVITSNIAGDLSNSYRSSDFISNTKNGKTQSIKNFINSKSVFLVGNSKDYDNITIFDSLIAKRCVFIPFKAPTIESGTDTATTSETANNKCLSVNVSRYYGINPKSSETEKKNAQDFLVWLNTSDVAKKYILSEFEYVPYDIDDSSVLENPLERETIDYISKNNFIPAIFKGAPSLWCKENIGKYIVDNLFIKSIWSYEDYENAVDYGIEKWKELQEESN